MADPAYIQSNSSTSGASGTALAVAYTSNVTAGSLLCAASWWNSTSLTCSLSDTKNTWLAVGGPTNGAGGLASFRFQLFYALNAQAGATTVTATDSGTTTSRGLAIHEVSGIQGLGTNAAFSTGSQDPVSVSLMNTRPVTYLFAAWLSEDNITTVDAPFTRREYANFGVNATADSVRTHAETWTATGHRTTGVPQGVIALMAEFYAAPYPSNGNLGLEYTQI